MFVASRARNWRFEVAANGPFLVQPKRAVTLMTTNIDEWRCSCATKTTNASRAGGRASSSRIHHVRLSIRFRPLCSSSSCATDDDYSDDSGVQRPEPSQGSRSSVQDEDRQTAMHSKQTVIKKKKKFGLVTVQEYILRTSQRHDDIQRTYNNSGLDNNTHTHYTTRKQPAELNSETNHQLPNPSSTSADRHA